MEEFWDSKLFKSWNKSMATWKYINEVAGRGKAGEVKDIEIGSFKKYLDNKIGKVKCEMVVFFQIELSSRISVLDEFLEVDEGEPVKMIMNLRNKQCFRSNPNLAIETNYKIDSTFFTYHFNSSFKSETVFQDLKLACMTPILKKPYLNQSDLSSYRPIPNFEITETADFRKNT